MLPEVGVILDAGSGIFRARDLIQTKHLDIYLSHVHLDHSFGLTFMFDVLFEKEMESVVVHGEADKLAAIDQHLFSEFLFPVKPPFDYQPIEQRQFDLPQGGTMTTFPLDHPGGSLGYRLDWEGHSMAYVTDTTAKADASYIDEIRDVDLLVHECYFPDGWEEKAELTGHSCTTPVAEVAKAANVKRLMLVHVNPLDESDDPIDLATAQAIFPATTIATDEQAVNF